MTNRNISQYSNHHICDGILQNSKTLAPCRFRKNGGAIYLHADIGNSPRNTNLPAIYHIFVLPVPSNIFCLYSEDYLRLQITLASSREGRTVKSSNFVILFGEKIFFLQTLFWLPHKFFWYWSLFSTGLGIGQSHFGLGQCLGLKISFFLGWRN